VAHSIRKDVIKPVGCRHLLKLRRGPIYSFIGPRRFFSGGCMVTGERPVPLVYEGMKHAGRGSKCEGGPGAIVIGKREGGENG
jgi:hypothetical protein